MPSAWRRVDRGGSGVDDTDPAGMPVSGSVPDRVAPSAGSEDPPATAAFVIARRGLGFAERMRNPASPPSFERTWIGGVREAGGVCSCSGCLAPGVVAVGVGSETGRGLERVPSARLLPGSA